MKCSLLLAIAANGLFVLPAMAAVQVDIPTRECTLAGLKMDGEAQETAAIQQAIDVCAEQGGGTLRFAAGQYRSGPLFLRNHIRLFLAEGARLLAATERELYRVNENNKKYEVQQGWIAFLNAVDVHDVEIAGPGVVDGQGASWWSYYLRHDGKGSPTNRPRLVYFGQVKNARLDGVTLTNSPSFHFVPHASEQIEVAGVKIIAPNHAPNTDGIDPSNTRNMWIHDCLIDTGDDNIAIKAGSVDPAHPQASVENIQISDCTFRSGHGASIGSETLGGVRHVTFERIHFIGTDTAIRIKSSRERGGEISDITYRDLIFDHVRDAITLSAYYPRIPTSDIAQQPTATTPYYHDITISHVSGDSTNPGNIVATPEKPFMNIRLENIHLDSSGALHVRNASLIAHDVRFGRGAAFKKEEGAEVKEETQ